MIIEKGFIPKWLNEGICIYVSGQNKFKKKPKFFNEFLNFSKNIKKEIYRESGFIVEYLLKEYGHEKIIKLLNESKKIKDEKDFKDKFEEIYKVPLGYPTFNQN